MSLSLPRVIQTPSPNYSPTLIQHDLLIAHMMEGGYGGSVSWLCQRAAEASSHLCMNEDGSEVTQLVPLSMKAWAEKSFNGCGASLEIPGFTAQGIPTARWEAAATIFGWLSVAYNVPPTWAQGGQGRGICQHHDLGVAGGGHVDCSPVGSPVWLAFVTMVQNARDEFAKAPLPAFALHGLPNPHEVQLPPNTPPTPSHGGAPRVDPKEVVVPHPTATKQPLGSMFDWQMRLKAVGANPMLLVDGDEGGATRAAIGTFQRVSGLTVTNEVNPATWAVLFALSEKRLAGK